MNKTTQDYVKELAKLLLAHGENKNSEGYRQLEDYVLQAVSPSSLIASDRAGECFDPGLDSCKTY
jgi:hypothetical protein